MHVFKIIPSLYILQIIDIKINISLVGIQTKGKFACLVYGTKMKSHHSRSLGKEVFDEYRNFLSKNHRYQTIEKYLFNGKEETRLKPQGMAPFLWKKLYKRYSNRQGIYA
jgi:23S rRNA U2552 (ribose-2'-O)-methylase RlmE/FtsJ